MKTCQLIGDSGVRSFRRLALVSGISPTTSIETLKILDVNKHFISFRVLDKHRLNNYQSMTSVNQLIGEDENLYTVVLESYVVEIQDGNTEEDTKTFTNLAVKINLQIFGRMAMKI
ncbi:hypothetical protein ACP275_08G224700 [Erythranthe tilingii]